MYKENVIEFTDNNTREVNELIHQKIQFWYEHVLFSGLWWVNLAFAILPWLLWLGFRKKESTNRLLFSGQFVIIVSLVLDLTGDQLGLWYYRFNVIPVFPTYVPWDLTLMPVTIMCFLQVKPDYNPYIKAVLFALVSSYLGEPFFQWMGIYVLTHWKFFYSVPIQFAIYLMAHYMARGNRYSPLGS
ncbi:CBO0543 family protein [Paenibacillus lycopersici]|uniref:CBO0543 family protein n=1 Tax=Paenibacillus lycopersici TaxID=2704462 RepID=UPI00384ADEF8